MSYLSRSGGVIPAHRSFVCGDMDRRGDPGYFELHTRAYGTVSVVLRA